MLAFDAAGRSLSISEAMCVVVPALRKSQFTAVVFPSSSTALSRVIIATPPPSLVLQGDAVARFVCAVCELFPVADKAQSPAEAPKLYPPPERDPVVCPPCLDMTLRWTEAAELSSVVPGDSARALAARFPRLGFIVAAMPSSTETMGAVAIAYVSPQPVDRDALLVPLPLVLPTLSAPARSAAGVTVMSAGTRRRWVGGG
jgi:hypothetical protein